MADKGHLNRANADSYKLNVQHAKELPFNGLPGFSTKLWNLFVDDGFDILAVTCYVMY